MPLWFLNDLRRRRILVTHPHQLRQHIEDIRVMLNPHEVFASPARRERDRDNDDG